MNTSLGYAKRTLTDTNVLLSGGGDKPLSNFISSISWDSTNKNISYTLANGTTGSITVYPSLSGGETVTNLNSLTNNKIYVHAGSSAVTGHPGETSYGTLLLLSNKDTPSPGTNGHWLALLDFIHNGSLYYRQSINTNTWQDWKRIYDDSYHPISYSELTGSGTTANLAIVSSGTTNGWSLVTLGSNAFTSTSFVTTSTELTISATKTFASDNFGEAIIVKRNNSLSSVICFSNNGGIIGYIGVSNGIPGFWDSSKNANVLLTQNNWSDYVGTSSAPVGYATNTTNIAGGAQGSIPYLTAAGTTAFLAGGTNGYVLAYNTTSKAPYWKADSNTQYYLTLNGTTKGTASTNNLGTIYAPTTSGTGFLKCSVSGNTITWSYDNSTYLTSHYTATPILGGSSATSNATSDTNDPYLNIIENSTKSGGILLKGSGSTSVIAKNGIATISSTNTLYYLTLNGSVKGTASTTNLGTIYAPTGAGTSGLYLKSNGSGAPSWTNFPTIPSITLNGSANTSPSFYAPTSGGTSGQYLKSNGTNAPTWATFDFASSGHDHTLNIETTNDTSTVTLTANTKYKLTAGGKTIVFTTPTDLVGTGGVTSVTGTFWGNSWSNGNSLTGSLITGTTTSNSEQAVGTQALAGKIYLYSLGSASGVRGIFSNNNAGTEQSVLTVDSNNAVTLYGNATSAGYLQPNNEIYNSYSTAALTYYTSHSSTVLAATSGVANPTTAFYYHLMMNYGNANGYFCDVAFRADDSSDPSIYYRIKANSNYSDWIKVITTDNISTYTSSNLTAKLLAPSSLGTSTNAKILILATSNNTTGTTSNVKSSNLYISTGFYVNKNGVYFTSDKKLKDNITKYVLKLNILDLENPIREFTWKGTEGRSVGFIAQEVEEWCPEAVCEDDDGCKAVNYDVALSSLCSALYDEVKALKKEIKELKNRK